MQKHKVYYQIYGNRQRPYPLYDRNRTKMFVSKIVNLIKSYTTYHIWKKYPNNLQKQFWRKHTFWTDGYLACSVGNVLEEMLRKYIENQGQKKGGDSRNVKSI